MIDFSLDCQLFSEGWQIQLFEEIMSHCSDDILLKIKEKIDEHFNNGQ